MRNTILQAMQVSQHYSDDNENEPPTLVQESSNTVADNPLQLQILKNITAHAEGNPRFKRQPTRFIR